MQGRVLSMELPGRIGQSVNLQGWVHRIRDLGGVRFLVMRDRTGFAQVVLPPDMDVGAIGCESVATVQGRCRA